MRSGTAASLSDDKFPDADFALASLLTDQKQFAEAEKLVRAGLLMQPDAWNGQLELARVLLATGRFAEAEQSALAVRKTKPEFSADLFAAGEYSSTAAPE